MNRRQFLKLTGLSGLAALLRPPLPELPPTPAPSTSAPSSPALRVLLLEHFIAGFQFHEGMRPEVLYRLEVGQTLQVVRRPDNRYDAQAIELRTQAGVMLGFVPRTQNSLPARLADQGIRLEAEIRAVQPEAPPWERVQVALYQCV